MGTSAPSLSQKISAKYRILLHLVLARENFGLLEEPEEDFDWGMPLKKGPLVKGCAIEEGSPCERVCRIQPSGTGFELHSTKIFDWPCKKYSNIDFGKAQTEQHWANNCIYSYSWCWPSVALSVLAKSRASLRKEMFHQLPLQKGWALYRSFPLQKGRCSRTTK